MAIRMTLLTSRADRGNELSKNCSMPKIQLAPNTANSKGDLEESIDLQTVEKLHKNPKSESAQHAIPKLIRRMSTTVGWTKMHDVFKSLLPRYFLKDIYVK